MKLTVCIETNGNGSQIYYENIAIDNFAICFTFFFNVSAHLVLYVTMYEETMDNW